MHGIRHVARNLTVSLSRHANMSGARERTVIIRLFVKCAVKRRIVGLTFLKN